MLSGNDNCDKFKILKIQDITPLSIGMECKDGAIVSVLIPKYTTIPAKKELLITTSSDHLSSFSIDVQECELASTTVFNLSGIAPKPRGISKINVSFEVDDSGILNVVAKDISVSEKNEIVISKKNDGLKPEDIEKMVEAAAQYKAEDEERKEKAAALNSLENCAYRMKAMAREARVPASDKKSMVEAADAAIAWLDTNPHAKIEDINSWKGKLESITRHVTMKII